MKLLGARNQPRTGSGVCRRLAGLLTLAAISAGALCAQQALLPADAKPAPDTQTSVLPRASLVPGKKLWQASLATLSVANILDVQSTLGKRELNSTLAGPSGTLGAQGILIKSALQGGLVGIEYLITRGHTHELVGSPRRSRLYRGLAVVNFAAGAILAGTAIHNYTVPRTQPQN